jgi:hypothetical protein
MKTAHVKEEEEATSHNTSSPKCLLHYHYANTSGECSNPLAEIFCRMKNKKKDRAQKKKY